MNEGETINLPFLPPIGQLFEGGHRYSMPPMPHMLSALLQARQRLSTPTRPGENCPENLKS